MYWNFQKVVLAQMKDPLAIEKQWKCGIEYYRITCTWVLEIFIKDNFRFKQILDWNIQLWFT